MKTYSHIDLEKVYEVTSTISKGSEKSIWIYCDDNDKVVDESENNILNAMLLVCTKCVEDDDNVFRIKYSQSSSSSTKKTGNDTVGCFGDIEVTFVNFDGTKEGREYLSDLIPVNVDENESYFAEFKIQAETPDADTLTMITTIYKEA